MQKRKTTPLSALSPKASKLVLASGSAKRKEILQGLNLRFISYSPDVDEITNATSPKELVTKNALLKLKAAKEKFSNHFIIAADTVVVSGRKIFFKPKTFSEGNKMLATYVKNSNATYNKNYVITGVTVYSPIIQKTICRTDSSSFKISLLPSTQLKKIYKRIFSTTQSGGFSIEDWGSVLISSITGSYYNVLGLPLHTLTAAFNELNTDLEIFLKTNHNKT